MLILCLKIFFVRILDVSLGTIRTILLIKGHKFISSLVGFIEVAIWFAIVREALSTDDFNLWTLFAYSGGFAVGTYIGALISERFIKGNFNVQIITKKDQKIIDLIRENGYAVSVIDVKGKDEDKNKQMLFIEINKNNFDSLQKLVKKLDEKAFIVVNETKLVQNGYFKK